MKKLLAFILILACIAVLASCSNGNESDKGKENGKYNGKDNGTVSLPCNHLNTVVLEGKLPTCQENGLTGGKKCQQCGEITVSQTITDKLECIESDWIIDLEPTLSQDGKRHTECTMCGKIIKDEVILHSIYIEMTPAEFVDNYLKVIESGDMTTDHLNEVKLLSTIYDIANGSHTASEFYSLAASGGIDGAGFTSFQVDQMYGLYLWDRMDSDSQKIVFETILDFMAIDIANDNDAKALIDEQTAKDLLDLSNGLEDFKSQMNELLTKEEFIIFGKGHFGNDAWVQPACNILYSLSPKTDGKARVFDILNLIDKVSYLVPAESLTMVKNYLYVYDAIQEKCTYGEFLGVLNQVVIALTGEERNINADESAVQQAYIMYLNGQGAVPNEAILGIDFICFVNDTVEANPTVSANLSTHSKDKLQDIIIMAEFILKGEKYDYQAMTELFSEMKKAIGDGWQSDNSFTELDIYEVYSIYYKNNK